MTTVNAIPALCGPRTLASKLLEATRGSSKTLLSDWLACAEDSGSRFALFFRVGSPGVDRVPSDFQSESRSTVDPENTSKWPGNSHGPGCSPRRDLAHFSVILYRAQWILYPNLRFCTRVEQPKASASKVRLGGSCGPPTSPSR